MIQGQDALGKVTRLRYATAGGDKGAFIEKCIASSNKDATWIKCRQKGHTL
jgi:hypothetical protein